jgi:hypothetical protein
MAKRLKAFVRYDGSGRIVPSSVILAANKPKVGNWKEIDANECCNPVSQLILYFTPESYPIVEPTINLFCDGISDYTFGAGGYTATDLTSLIEILQGEPGIAALGTFSAQLDGSVQFIPNAETISLYCSTGSLTFTITPN